MSAALELMKRYPEQFRQYFEGTIQTSCMAWGLEVPDGWLPMIENVCYACEHQNLPVEWAQVKEKFGQLRMYYGLTQEDEDGNYFMAVQALVGGAELAVDDYESHRRSLED